MEQKCKILNSNGNLSKPSAEQLNYNELSHICIEFEMSDYVYVISGREIVQTCALDCTTDFTTLFHCLIYGK